MEDELGFIDIYRRIFDSLNFNIVGWAQSGEEAVEKLTKLEMRPDIIIMDNRLPGMSGVDTTVKILETNPTASILFVSVDEGSKERALKSGAVGFLRKPFSLQDFISSVTRYATKSDRGNNLSARRTARMERTDQRPESPTLGAKMGEGDPPAPSNLFPRGAIIAKVEIVVNQLNGGLSGKNSDRLRQTILSITGIAEGSFKERIVRHMFLDDDKRIRKFTLGIGEVTLTMEGLTNHEAERIKREVERILEEEG